MEALPYPIIIVTLTRLPPLMKKAEATVLVSVLENHYTLLYPLTASNHPTIQRMMKMISAKET